MSEIGDWKARRRQVVDNIKEEEGEEKEPIKYTSSVVNSDFIVEEILNSSHPKFAIYEVKTGEIVVEDEFRWEGIRYKPFDESHEEIGVKAVLLPGKAIEYGDLPTLILEIRDFIDRWLDIPDSEKKLAVYQILLSWVYERFPTLSYPRALGDTGTGKSRFLDVIGGLCYKAMFMSGAMNVAPIFRTISKWKGTLVIDEADPKDESDESNYLIKIFNCGYEKGRPVARCDEKDRNKILFFDVFGPKVFATRKRFGDKALESRCSTSIMQQTGNQKIKDNLTEKFYTERDELRNKLLMFRFKNYWSVSPEDGMNVNLPGIEPRLRQVNRAILSLLSKDETTLTEFVEDLKNKQAELIEERLGSYDGQIVKAVCDLILENSDAITPAMICDSLNTQLEGDKFSYKPAVVGRHLKALGIETKRVKVDKKTVNTVHFTEENLPHFKEILSRYITDEEEKQEILDRLVLLVSINKPKTEQKLEDYDEVEASSVTAVTPVTVVIANPPEPPKLPPLDSNYKNLES